MTRWAIAKYKATGVNCARRYIYRCVWAAALCILNAHTRFVCSWALIVNLGTRRVAFTIKVPLHGSIYASERDEFWINNFPFPRHSSLLFWNFTQPALGNHMHNIRVVWICDLISLRSSLLFWLWAYTFLGEPYEEVAASLFIMHKRVRSQGSQFHSAGLFYGAQSNWCNFLKAMPLFCGI